MASILGKGRLSCNTAKRSGHFLLGRPAEMVPLFCYGLQSQPFTRGPRSTRKLAIPPSDKLLCGGCSAV